MTVRVFPAFLRSFSSFSRNAEDWGKKFSRQFNSRSEFDVTVVIFIDFSDSLVDRTSSLNSGDLTPSSSCLKPAKLFACSFPLKSDIFSVFFSFSASLPLLGRLHASPRILQSSPSSPSSLQSHMKIFILIWYQDIKNHRDPPPPRHFFCCKKRMTSILHVAQPDLHKVTTWLTFIENAYDATHTGVLVLKLDLQIDRQTNSNRQQKNKQTMPGRGYPTTSNKIL